MSVEIILAILALAAKYGISAVQEIIEEWNSDKPITIDDINSFKLRFDDPASYFNKDDK